jgi:3-hydroxyacyl-CoA dehydrogenase
VPHIKKAAILGGGGTMGSLSGGIFAQAGIPCIFFDRTIEIARKGMDNAVRQARSDILRSYITPRTNEDLEKELPGCDWILEAVPENLTLKREILQNIDRLRKKGSVLSTITSSLSIKDMVEDCSRDLKAHFCGVHFFNPPGKLPANEIIHHPDNSGEFKSFVSHFCEQALRRINIITQDTPGFAGNRIGFQFLNEAAIHAETHGVETIDYLLGPHTGRSLPPLATLDLVGLDVHREIVNNIDARVQDERNDSFRLPHYVDTMIAENMLGRKGAGGFWRITDKNGILALSPLTLEYSKAAEVKNSLVEKLKLHIHDGRYDKAIDILKKENSGGIELMRRFILGYVSYSFSRVGEVTESEAGIHSIDKVMAYGFSWLPPSGWVDLLGGPRETVRLLDAGGLPIPGHLDGMKERRLCRIPEATRYLIAH